MASFFRLGLVPQLYQSSQQRRIHLILERRARCSASFLERWGCCLENDYSRVGPACLLYTILQLTELFRSKQVASSLQLNIYILYQCYDRDQRLKTTSRKMQQWSVIFSPTSRLVSLVLQTLVVLLFYKLGILPCDLFQIGGTISHAVRLFILDMNRRACAIIHETELFRSKVVVLVQQCISQCYQVRLN